MYRYFGARSRRNERGLQIPQGRSRRPPAGTRAPGRLGQCRRPRLLAGMVGVFHPPRMDAAWPRIPLPAPASTSPWVHWSRSGRDCLHGGSCLRRSARARRRSRFQGPGPGCAAGPCSRPLRDGSRHPERAPDSICPGGGHAKPPPRIPGATALKPAAAACCTPGWTDLAETEAEGLFAQGDRFFLRRHPFWLLG